MVNREDAQVTIQATDYLSKISLDVKPGDLKNNPALVKRFLVDLREAKADNLALRDSLKAIQNAMENLNSAHANETEKLKNANHELDKENAVLKSAAKIRLGVIIIQDLTAGGFGGGIGALIAGQTTIGLAIAAPCLLVYIICRLINSLSIKSQ